MKISLSNSIFIPAITKYLLILEIIRIDYKLKSEDFISESY